MISASGGGHGSGVVDGRLDVRRRRCAGRRDGAETLTFGCQWRRGRGYERSAGRRQAVMARNARV